MRGKPAPKRAIAPDVKFNREDVAKFINYIMDGGKKTIAQNIVYDMMEIVSKKTKQDPAEVFDTAIKNIAPTVEIRGKRVGGAN